MSSLPSSYVARAVRVAPTIALLRLILAVKLDHHLMARGNHTMSLGSGRPPLAPVLRATFPLHLPTIPNTIVEHQLPSRVIPATVTSGPQLSLRRPVPRAKDSKGCAIVTARWLGRPLARSQSTSALSASLPLLRYLPPASSDKSRVSPRWLAGVIATQASLWRTARRRRRSPADSSDKRRGNPRCLARVVTTRTSLWGTTRGPRRSARW